MKGVIFFTTSFFLIIFSYNVLAYEINAEVPKYFFSGVPQQISFSVNHTVNETPEIIIYFGAGAKSGIVYLENGSFAEKKNITINSSQIKNAIIKIPDYFYKNESIKLFFAEKDNTNITKYFETILLGDENKSSIKIYYESLENTTMKVRGSAGLIHSYPTKLFLNESIEKNPFYSFPLLSGMKLSSGDLFENLSLSENETKNIGNIFDMSLEFNIGDELFPNLLYENIFIIKNNFHKTGEREDITAFVEFSIEDENGNKSIYNFTKKGINSYTKTGTGKLILEEGNYTICGNLIQINASEEMASDPYQQNNKICKNVSVFFEIKNETCDVGINLISEKTISEKETIINLSVNNSDNFNNFISIEKTDLITGKKEYFSFYETRPEFSQEIRFDDYSMYQINTEIIPGCVDENKADNKAQAIVYYIKNDDYGLESFLVNKTYRALENISIPLYIYNGKNHECEIEIESTLRRQKSPGWEETEKIYENKFRIKPDSALSFPINSTIKNNSVTGYYKIQNRIKCNGSYRYSDNYLSIEGLPDMGEAYIKIINHPESMKFGEISSVVFDFYSGNYDNINGTFVVFINKFIDEDKYSYASVDFGLNALKNKIYETDIAANIEIKRGSNYLISLPLFVNPNCNDNYKPGLYEGSVRAYLHENKRKYTSSPFNITLKTGEKGLCNDKTCPSCSVKSDGDVNIKPTEENKREVFFPDEVYPGEEFTVETDIENENNESVNVTVYSYVYDGNNLISLGLNGEAWRKSWTANKNIFSMKPLSKKTVHLFNKIKENITAGEYNLKVRKIINDKKYDEVWPIKVIEKPVNPILPNVKSYTLKIKSEAENKAAVIECEPPCPDCNVIISGPEIFESRKIPSIIETRSNGVYNFILTKNNVVIENKSIRITKNENTKKSDINIKENPEYNGIPTGAFVGKPVSINWLDTLLRIVLVFL